MVTLLQPDSSVDWKVARDKNLRVSFELMLTPMFLGLHAARLQQTKILEQGAALFDSGQLQVFVSEVLPLQDAARAHQMIEHGAVRTPFMKYGDQVRIEMFDDAGRSIFGAIEQTVAPLQET